MAIPYKCPVCEGRGFVHSGFYSLSDSSSNCMSELCRSCLGAGILWDFSGNLDTTNIPNRIDTSKGPSDNNSITPGDVKEWT